MDYINYIRPELLILIPVLIVIGKILKNSVLNNKYIPLILGVISIFLSCLWVLGNTSDNIPNAILTAIIQGILCAGAAVYGNQIFKQYKKND